MIGRVFRPANTVRAGITVVQMLREASVGTDWILEEVTCVVFYGAHSGVSLVWIVGKRS